MMLLWLPVSSRYEIWKNPPKIGQRAKKSKKKRNSHSCTAVGWKFSQDQWVVGWWQGQQRSIQAKTASRDREVVAGFCHSTTCEIFTQLRLIITFHLEQNLIITFDLGQNLIITFDLEQNLIITLDLEQNLIITFCQEQRCVSHFRSHFSWESKKN